jgi:hypothetical protein
VNPHYAPPVDLIESVLALLDRVIILHSNYASGETLTECQMCGGWEGHDDACPVPVIVWWLSVPHDGKEC